MSATGYKTSKYIKTVNYQLLQSLVHTFFADDGLFTGYNIESGPNPSHIARYLVSENGLEEVATTDDQNANFVNGKSVFCLVLKY